MTDDMIREHLARAHLAESVTLDAGTWTEVLQEVQRLRSGIETLYQMYEQACRQRDELMNQQRAQIEAMRGRLQ